MKCPVCSQVFPDTLAKCSRCGRVPPEKAAADGGSTLIEFPSAKVIGARSAALPDWRAELNEKVRAVKARRDMEARVEAATVARRPARSAPIAPPVEPEPERVEENPNPIVAAALNRVRRATENAARATAAVVIAEPMGRAVESPRVFTLPQLLPSPPVDEPGPLSAEAAHAESLKFDPSELLADFDDLDSLNDFPEDPIARLANVQVHEDAPLHARVFGAVIDLAILSVAVAPFVATVQIVEGNFARTAVQVLLTSTLLLVVAFYLFVTLAVSGRTMGMVYARTRVVLAETGEAPGAIDALLRVVGTFVAALPLGLGLLWAFVARDHRGLHDRLSGTRVVEE